MRSTPCSRRVLSLVRQRLGAGNHDTARKLHTENPTVIKERLHSTLPKVLKIVQLCLTTCDNHGFIHPSLMDLCILPPYTEAALFLKNPPAVMITFRLVCVARFAVSYTGETESTRSILCETMLAMELPSRLQIGRV